MSVFDWLFAWLKPYRKWSGGVWSYVKYTRAAASFRESNCCVHCPVRSFGFEYSIEWKRGAVQPVNGQYYGRSILKMEVYP